MSKNVTVYRVHYVGTLHGDCEYNDDGYSQSGEDGHTLPELYADYHDALRAAERADHHFLNPSPYYGGPFAYMGEEGGTGEEDKASSRLKCSVREFDGWLAMLGLPTLSQFYEEGKASVRVDMDDPDSVDDFDWLVELQEWYEWAVYNKTVNSDKFRKFLSMLVNPLRVHTVNSTTVPLANVIEFCKTLKENEPDFKIGVHDV